MFQHIHLYRQALFCIHFAEHEFFMQFVAYTSKCFFQS